MSGLLKDFMRGEPLVTKAAAVAKYGVLPAAMIAALIYSPPNYVSSKKQAPSSTATGSSSG